MTMTKKNTNKRIVLHVHNETRVATPRFLYAGRERPAPKHFVEMGKRLERIFPYAVLIAFDPDFLFGCVGYQVDYKSTAKVNPIGNTHPVEQHFEQVTNGSFTLPLRVAVSILKAVGDLPGFVSEVPWENEWDGFEVVKVKASSGDT
jgi:hypothetical protein